MGFGFFKSKKESPATPKSHSSSKSDLRRKTSTRASAPTTPSPRFLDDSDSSTRANSFSGGDYRSLDPKLDFAATSNAQPATTNSISRGFLDDVLFDFDSKLAFDQSKPSPASTKSRAAREPQTTNEPLASRSKQQSSAKLQYQSAGQATTSKVYSLGISKVNVADASPRSAPVESSKRGPEDLLFAEALQLYDKATNGTAQRPSSSRRQKSSNRQQRDAPSPARSPVKYNRRARENPEKYMAAAITTPSTEDIATPTVRRSSSRGRSRGRRAVADKVAPPTSRGRHRMQPAESSGTESEDDEDDHVPIHASLAAVAAARSRARSASRGPRGMPMPVEPRSTSLARQRSLNRHPQPLQPPQSQSRSRGGRRRGEVDGSSSESDEEAPLVGVRIQAIEEQQQKGRRQRVVPPRQRSVEPPPSSAPSTSRSRSVDITPGRRRNQPSNDMAPPPPQDRVTPLGHLSPQQQQSMAMAQQQQMWAAFYHQAAAYQQAAFQQMQQQMSGGGPLVPLSPMATGAAVPGMMPPAYAVLPPTTAPVRKRSLFRKRSNAMLTDSEPSVGAAIASA
ncbi:hypothetical protein BC832DRAFT_278427 [Gaertneriomyces semiglobifer]|nr:hypothetical protein BC832DRAFT_278427 [Gaertneriomyces semiglobifer]